MVVGFIKMDHIIRLEIKNFLQLKNFFLSIFSFSLLIDQSLISLQSTSFLTKGFQFIFKYFQLIGIREGAKKIPMAGTLFGGEEGGN